MTLLLTDIDIAQVLSTGVAVRKLARKDSKKAALIGSGWQAGAAAWALAESQSLFSPRVS